MKDISRNPSNCLDESSSSSLPIEPMDSWDRFSPSSTFEMLIIRSSWPINYDTLIFEIEMAEPRPQSFDRLCLLLVIACTPKWIDFEWFSAIDKFMIVSLYSAFSYSKLIELVALSMFYLAVTKFAPSKDISTKYFRGSPSSSFYGQSNVKFFTLMRISVGAAAFLLGFGVWCGVILMLRFYNLSFAFICVFGCRSFFSSVFSSSCCLSFWSSSRLSFVSSSLFSSISCSGCCLSAVRYSY